MSTLIVTATTGIVQCPNGSWQLVFARQIWNLPPSSPTRMNLTEALENELNFFKMWSNLRYGYGATNLEAMDIAEANRQSGAGNWVTQERIMTHVAWDGGNNYNRAGEWLWNGLGLFEGIGSVGINLIYSYTYYYHPQYPDSGHIGYAKNHKINVVEILPAPPCPTPTPIPTPTPTPKIYLGTAAPPPPPPKNMNCCDCNTIASIIESQMLARDRLVENLKDHIDQRFIEERPVRRKELEALEVDLQPVLDRVDKAVDTLWNGAKQ